MNIDSISVRDGTLCFDYSVYSYRPDHVYLMSNLFGDDRSGNVSIDPDLVYAYQLPGAPLSICKQFLPVPDGLVRDRLEIPLASLLEPGWSMTETIRVPLPIQFNHPYLEGNDRGNFSTDHFTFTIGYVLAEEDIEFREIVTVGDNDYLRLEHDYLLTHQRLKKSPPVKADLTF